ncbi:MAG TPA: PDZ domain-containing protein [Longimicrobiales bacterium]|nr:PDZ domain-containing protein [Longimicrobiales bacterium]
MRQHTLAAIAALLATAASLALATPSGAFAQTVRRECTPTASLGISRWVVHDGTIVTRDDGTTRYEFRTEPVIAAVRRGGPADGRLRSGDVLVRIDGDLVTTPAGWHRLERLRQGQRVVLTVRRHDREVRTPIEVGRECRPPRAPAPAPPSRPLELPSLPELPRLPSPPALPAPPAPAIGPDGPPLYLGLSFQCTSCVGIVNRDEDGEATGGIRWAFREPPVLSAVTRGGPAWEGGLRSGDRLVEVGEADITTDAGSDAFEGLEPGKAARFTVERDGRRRTFTVTPERVPRAPRFRVAPNPPTGLEYAYSPADESSPLRYSDVLGDVAVEVRGDPANTYYDADKGELIIRAPGTWIRLRLTERR